MQGETGKEQPDYSDAITLAFQQPMKKPLATGNEVCEMFQYLNIHNWFIKKTNRPYMKTRLILTVSAAILAGCQSSEKSTTHIPAYSPPVAQKTTEPSPAAAGVEVLDQAEVSLHKEELVVGKREVSNGGIMVRTVVKSEEVQQPVELRREEYVVERIPAGSAKDLEARSGKAFDAREIYIPLMKEEPVTGKRTLLTESITLNKKVETTQQTVTSPVRTESVRVVKDPDLSDPKFAAVPRRSSGSAVLVSAAGSSAGSETGSGSSINIHKEELMIAKQEKDAGGVYLQKIVETENVSKPVELRREDYTIERKPLSGEVASSEFAPRQIQLSLTREEPVAETRNYLTEVVRISKQTQTDKQMVTGTVRQETAEIVPITESSASAQGAAPSAQSGSSSSQTTSPETNGESLDDLLESRITTSLQKPHAGFGGYEQIVVIAKDGEVTLRGDVTSDTEKKAITKRVREMSGVRSVNNELRVIKASEPTK